MIFLVISELFIFMNVKVTSEVGVDTSFGLKLPINIDIFSFSLPPIILNSICLSQLMLSVFFFYKHRFYNARLKLWSIWIGFYGLCWRSNIRSGG